MKAGNTRINLAYISPVNPIPNGLSDYSEALLPALSELADITLYSDCGTPSNPLIAERFVTRPISSLPRYRAEHDLRLYQIGNSPDHRNAFDNLRRLPGIVTLHEPFLHHGFLSISRTRYRREVFYELGTADENEVERLMALTMKDDRAQLLALPLIGRIVDSSLGIVVHNQTARRMIEEHRLARTTFRDSEITVIPHLMPIPSISCPGANRSELKLPTEALVIGMAGVVHPTKEPSLVLQAFAQASANLPNAWLAFIGALPVNCDLPALARDLGIADRVTFLGRVDPIDRMHRVIAACDLLVNLRQPTIGETSGTALRAMALGRPLIVRNVGWYSELPDGTCLKISPTAGVAELASVILVLGTSPDTRQSMGEQARRYVQTECNVATVARRYADFLKSVYERVTVC